MSRLAVFALVVATLGCAAVTIGTAPLLPAVVASHFGAGGAANGFMTRSGYVAFMLAFGAGLPWLVYLVAGELVARFPAAMRFKGADYWLAPPRREATVASLRSFGAIVATLVALIVTAAHLAVLEAHRRTPPTLDEAPFLAGVAVFAIAIVAVAILHRRRFGRPPELRPRQ